MREDAEQNEGHVVDCKQRSTLQDETGIYNSAANLKVDYFRLPTYDELPRGLPAKIINRTLPR